MAKTARTLQDYVTILWIATRLGFTSFGGPIAHLGFFHEEYVKRKKWLDEKSYADLVALCQFLPGPASSQVGIGVGIIRGGAIGGFLAFLGFTLPSVIALMLFALAMHQFSFGDASFIHGLKIVAVAVVAHAIVGMGKKLTPDLPRKAIALISLTVMLLWQTTFTQIGVILVAALIGIFLFRHHDTKESAHEFQLGISKKTAIISISLFFLLLIALPLINQFIDWRWVAMFDSFYRSGALVFGGGHVVLPLLEQEFVPTGWLTEEEFLAGYGAAQAIPGPLFTFAAYLGTVIGGVSGGLIATVAIFLPAFLLIFSTLPVWHALRHISVVRGALMSVNASVIGILIAALYQPIWTSTIMEAKDFMLAAILFSLLAYWKLPSWVIVIIGFIGGMLLPYIPL
ncbi:chromate transporter [Gracilibacillus halophilus YIM-C55.5]|uniref:Chromate transporter n=1 Tax=Gracilibacillus halophilus YIM-C55.5 TaxID=1308866 RepID=N4WHN4_9BACI|nr:chromate efflux transporter [Gracilibacillus halophilus]ENH95692.1 chromate transporter [Gracilibacillus halophilus YIM-C55.5]